MKLLSTGKWLLLSAMSLQTRSPPSPQSTVDAHSCYANTAPERYRTMCNDRQRCVQPMNVDGRGVARRQPEAPQHSTASAPSGRGPRPAAPTGPIPAGPHTPGTSSRDDPWLHDRGGVPRAVHWDAGLELLHSPSGTRLPPLPGVPTRDWHPRWGEAPGPLEGADDGGGGGGGCDSVGGWLGWHSWRQWQWREALAGWEIIAAFALALVLVNGIAISRAGGIGLSRFRGERAFLIGRPRI